MSVNKDYQLIFRCSPLQDNSFDYRSGTDRISLLIFLLLLFFFLFLMSAVTPFHTEKCCHLVSAHAASARRICSSVRQILIDSILVLANFLTGGHALIVLLPLHVILAFMSSPNIFKKSSAVAESADRTAFV